MKYSRSWSENKQTGKMKRETLTVALVSILIALIALLFLLKNILP